MDSEQEGHELANHLEPTDLGQLDYAQLTTQLGRTDQRLYELRRPRSDAHQSSWPRLASTKPLSAGGGSASPEGQRKRFTWLVCRRLPG